MYLDVLLLNKIADSDSNKNHHFGLLMAQKFRKSSEKLNDIAILARKFKLIRNVLEIFLNLL